MLWTEVLMSQKFTALGAAQFVRDLDAICSLIERYVRDGSNALGSLLDAARLLNLPLIAQKEGDTSLEQASDVLFTDNTEAKKLLEGLHMESITPSNARHILQRRVEASN